jgi:hypothetical protein
VLCPDVWGAHTLACCQHMRQLAGLLQCLLGATRVGVMVGQCPIRTSVRECGARGGAVIHQWPLADNAGSSSSQSACSCRFSMYVILVCPAPACMKARQGPAETFEAALTFERVVPCPSMASVAWCFEMEGAFDERMHTTSSSLISQTNHGCNLVIHSCLNKHGVSDYTSSDQ